MTQPKITNPKEITVKGASVNISADSAPLLAATKGCTACEKGLEYIAKKIMSGRDIEMKKLKLCERCRAILLETLREVFNK